MTAQPEPTVAARAGEGARTCSDCGLPMADTGPTGRPVPVCQACYDAYVDNAGR